MNIQTLSHITAIISIVVFFGFCAYKYTKQNHDYKW